MSTKETKKDNLVEMSVSGIGIDPYSNTPFLVLEDSAKLHKIPIWIGLFEASAIATHLENIKLARPMTHDLICNVIQDLHVTFKQIEIYDLKNNTFYARLVLVHGEKEIIVDSRPSDAIAVALRMKAPIMMHKIVIEKSKEIDLTKKVIQDKEQVSKEKWKEILENLSPDDFGKYKM